MITAIKGELEVLGVDWADLSVGGVTLRIYLPASDVDQLGRPGDRVRLFTSLQVREDSLTLYGFINAEARLAFEALIGISGVGPRVAVSILSTLATDSLALAVASGDTDAFVGVPGVGKKIASRIVLELKGKLAEDWAVAPGMPGAGDVLQALTALGYSLTEARAAIAGLPPGDSQPLEERVRQALQRIGSR